MSETDIHEGSCLCGNIRFRATGKPNRSVTCHCTMCQKAAGAPFMTLLDFPAGAVTWTTRQPTYYKSSDIANRGFCPDCGTALTFQFVDSPNIDISVAAFDAPNAFPPEEHLWTDSKIDWVEITGGLPQHPRGRTSS